CRRPTPSRARLTGNRLRLRALSIGPIPCLSLATNPPVPAIAGGCKRASAHPSGRALRYPGAALDRVPYRWPLRRLPTAVAARTLAPLVPQATCPSPERRGWRGTRARAGGIARQTACGLDGSRRLRAPHARRGTRAVAACHRITIPLRASAAAAPALPAHP